MSQWPAGRTASGGRELGGKKNRRPGKEEIKSSGVRPRKE